MTAPLGTGKGGRRPGAGRKTGTPNKLKSAEVQEVKALAQLHAPSAIERLAFLAQKAESEAASVAACNSLLDRAYGKAPQAVAVTGEGGGPVDHVIQVVTGVPRSSA